MQDNQPHKSIFHFLKKDFPFLLNIAQSAEYYLYSDPPVALSKLRIFAEKTTAMILGEHGLNYPREDSFHNRLHLLRREGILNDVKIRNCFYQIKEKENIASHGGSGTEGEASWALRKAFLIAIWIVEVYGDGAIITEKFEKPPNKDARHALNELKKDYSNLEKLYEAQLEKIKELGKKRSKEEVDNLKLKAFLASNRMDLSEAETRQIIDEQLVNAGWEADTLLLDYGKGARPEKGKNKAIAEWPVTGGRADYALFIGEICYGFIEAKKKKKEVLSDMKQAKRYGRDANLKHGEKYLGKFNQYHVPFLFATNSEGYHFMLENRSGTWFLDARKTTNHPKPLKGWFSPQNLKELYEKDLDQANKNLQIDPYEYLKNPKGLNFRYYQLAATKAIEQAVGESDTNQALLAMATGTGKTRTILGIIYRLLKAKRFKRVLFLVDRKALGTQAAGDFKDILIEDLETFANIYDIKEIKHILPELDTKVHFATVQGMYRRIFDNAKDDKVPSVGVYDCIVVDEAHRGYNLDQEMDENEIQFRDQSDYRSKYRQVIEYFDAFCIGLTATPAPHTINIFGHPIYEYGYNRAVVDGFLVGYEPPYIIKTQLSESGIRWAAGENVKVYHNLTREVEELEAIEDEINVEISGFNKTVITESFNRTVLQELIKYISPFGPEKTLIIAATDNHANDLVRWLKDEYVKDGLEVEDDAILKITGDTDKVNDVISAYKNEVNPVIAVTVDLLTTGINVPKISNIVFMRRVRSRILYEQIMGRATRLCEEIGKNSFRVFDAVGIYQSLEDFTNMKPVVTSPKANFQDLVDELAVIDKLDTATKELARDRHIEQIIAKLHRKKQRLTTEQAEQFKSLSGGLTPDEFIEEIRAKEKTDVPVFLAENKKLFLLLDGMKPPPNYTLISEHEDQHLDTVRDYEVTYNGMDYLEKFREYILENRNKLAALEIICTRPKLLTRESLKELQLQLALEGFDKTKLKTAWKNANNEDIAADIIAYIRSLALGSPLLSQKERIKNAMQKVRAMKKWDNRQDLWLKRFESQLLEENILHKEDLEKGIFKREGGGYARLNRRIFGNELDNVLEVINDNLYQESA